ncbi:hypothetical protein BC936DRAFT_149826 [Jimgerdemannia flammicorona]|uniref:Uncharacterized protein n=1 Tax=Jimgerdemannia flammicorona TaxID=994334 RepID=A0A433DN61_9FUNG|nr:hypothetical protein BC936DRAFT_149826 [Jimgerdemannia flammicorona]
MDSQFTRTAGPRAVRSYQNLHNRTALMGEPARTPSPNLSSGLSRSFSGQTSSSAPTSSSSFKVKMDDSELDQLEGQNDDQIGGLREKVAKLKNVSNIYTFGGDTLSSRRRRRVARKETLKMQKVAWRKE